MFIHWLGLFICIGVLLLVSRKSLPLAFALSAVTLGIFTLSPIGIWMGIWNTVTDPSILLLALAMGIIPMIGGVMEESGQMDRLVNNLRIGKRAFLVLSPALVGMLPVPGGALLSAPLVERVGEGVEGKAKAALNVWFRHIPFLLYPLGPALIVSAKIAGLGVYRVIPYLFPSFLVTLAIGWFFFLRGVEGKITYRGQFSIRNLLLPLGIILLAPLLDFLLQRTASVHKSFGPGVEGWTTVIAVSCSLVLALLLSDLSWNDIRGISKSMAPWNFSLMIIGMFIFFNIFKASGIPELMASLAFSEPVLCLVSFFLGAATGRIQLPTSVVIPTYLSMVGGNPMNPVVFAFIFFSTLLGYFMSPVHPCVSVSVEYFGVRIGDYLKAMALPTFIALALTLVFTLIL